MSRPNSPITLTYEIMYHEPRWRGDPPQIADLVEQCRPHWQGVCRAQSWAPLFEEAAISLVLTNNSEIRTLNAEWRGKDTPTNVLSFAHMDDSAHIESSRDLPCLELGDVILAWETMKDEAREQDISLADHSMHLLTHGFLHLLGYDHRTDKDAMEMEGLEINILRKMGIANPYEARDTVNVR